MDCSFTGWVMQVANCIFLQRKWEKDKIIMNSQLKYFDDIGQVFQVSFALLYSFYDSHNELVQIKHNHYGRSWY